MNLVLHIILKQCTLPTYDRYTDGILQRASGTFELYHSPRVIYNTRPVYLEGVSGQKCTGVHYLKLGFNSKNLTEISGGCHIPPSGWCVSLIMRQYEAGRVDGSDNHPAIGGLASLIMRFMCGCGVVFNIEQGWSHTLTSLE